MALPPRAAFVCQYDLPCAFRRLPIFLSSPKRAVDPPAVHTLSYQSTDAAENPSATDRPGSIQRLYGMLAAATIWRSTKKGTILERFQSKADFLGTPVDLTFIGLDNDLMPFGPVWLCLYFHWLLPNARTHKVTIRRVDDAHHTSLDSRLSEGHRA